MNTPEFWYSLVFTLAAAAGALWLLSLLRSRKSGRGYPLPVAAVGVAAVILAVRLALYRTGLLPEGGAYGAGEAWVMAAVDVLRYFTMNMEYQLIGLGGESDTAFRMLDAALCFLAPVCTFTAVFSLLRRLWHLQCWLHLFRPMYYFSELNEKSLYLAQSIFRRWKAAPLLQSRPVLVFCGAESEGPYSAEAKKLGAVFYADPIQSVPINQLRLHKLTVFLIDQKEETINTAFLKLRPLLDTPVKRLQAERQMYLFSTLESTVLLVDNELERMRRDEEKKQVYAFQLRLVNETMIMAQNLLYEHPLFETGDMKKDGHISMLVVGCGYLGTQITAAAMISGVMDSCTMKIQVIDRDAKLIESRFRHDSPGLYCHAEVIEEDGGRDIQPKFHTADVRTEEMDKVLKEHCGDCNYIVVCTDDDELNVTTAVFLRRWYCREHPGENRPEIFAAIRNREHYDSMAVLERKQKLNIHRFGCSTEIYSVEGVLERKMDQAAAMFNDCYDSTGGGLDMRRLCGHPEEVAVQIRHKLFRQKVVNQRSNQMVALHTVYKVRDALLAAGLTADAAADNADTDALRVVMKAMAAHAPKLHRLEHRRWTMFQLIDGWVVYPADQIPKGGDHRDPNGKRHGCIRSYEQLPGFAKDIQSASDFQSYDKAMCCASIMCWINLNMEPAQARQQRIKLLKQSIRMLCPEDEHTPLCVGCEDCMDFLQEVFAGEKELVTE